MESTPPRLPSDAGAAWAIAAKDLRLLFREPIALFFAIIFPLGVGVLFGVIFAGGGKPRNIDLCLVDLDASPASAAFAAELAAQDGLRVRTLATRTEGLEQVRSGRAAACVVLTPGFGDGAANIFSGGGMTIELAVDPTRKAEAGLLTGKLNELAFKRVADSFTSPAALRQSVGSARSSMDESTPPEWRSVLSPLFSQLDALADQQEAQAGAGGGFAFSPVSVEVHEVSGKKSGPRSSFDFTFPQAIVWSLMGCVTAFVTSLAAERTGGTFLRLIAAPITRRQILYGKALGCFITALGAQVLLLALGVLIFKITVNSYPLLLAAVLCSSLGFTGVMLMLSVLSHSEASAGGIGRAALIVLTLFGGGSIPIVFMPEWMQRATSISPFKWAIVAVEGATWRAAAPAEMLLPLGVLLSFAAVGFLIGWFVFHRANAAA